MRGEYTIQPMEILIVFIAESGFNMGFDGRKKHPLVLSKKPTELLLIVLAQSDYSLLFE